MTDQPGWVAPEGEPRPRPPVSSGWAAEQPPPASYGAPSYGGGPRGAPSYGGPGAGQAYGGPGQPPVAPPAAPGTQGWGAPPPPGWGAQPAWSPPKPGVIPLRPLGAMEILDGAVSTVRAKPRIMLGLSALVAVATQLVTVPITWLLLRDVGDSTFSFDQGTAANQNDFAVTASALSASVVQGLVTLIATLLLTGILTVALSRAVLGQSIDTAEAWAQAKPRLVPLFGVTLLVLLIEAVIAVVGLGPGVLLAVLGAPGLVSGLVIAAGAVAMVCVGVYVYVAFAMAPAVVVLEKQGVLAALRRSRRLVKGAWWRTFGILLLINVIAQIVSSILAVPFTVLSLGVAYVMGGSNGLNPYEIVPLLVTAVGTIVASAVTWPFTAVSLALVYIDRRMRREALDLELARAAGYPPQGQSATPGTPLTGDSRTGEPRTGGPLDGAHHGGTAPPPYGG